MIAITEDNINANFAARFNSRLKSSKNRELREFKHAIEDEGEIDATLGAPSVELVVRAET